MELSLPYFGSPCAVPSPIVLKVKNPLILKANEGKSENYSYFIQGDIIDVIHNSCDKFYRVSLNDSLFVDTTPQLYYTDFDKWSTDIVLIEYFQEIASDRIRPIVYTTNKFSGTGMFDNPLDLNIDTIDGRR